MTRKQPDNYTKLKKIWYAKLKKSGFNDIEQDEDTLKEWSSSGSRNTRGPIYNQARQDYYYYATHFLNDYNFESKTDRIIWEYHANGIMNKDIVRLLAGVRIKISISTVKVKIRKLRAIMRLNTYESKNE